MLIGTTAAINCLVASRFSAASLSVLSVAVNLEPPGPSTVADSSLDSRWPARRTASLAFFRRRSAAAIFMRGSMESRAISVRMRASSSAVQWLTL